MHHAAWKNLADFSNVREDFSHTARWAKAEIVPAQGPRIRSRVQLPCIQADMESFSNITGKHVGFNYYSYAAGDGLLTHDDTD